MLNNTL